MPASSSSNFFIPSAILPTPSVIALTRSARPIPATPIPANAAAINNNPGLATLPASPKAITPAATTPIPIASALNVNPLGKRALRIPPPDPSFSTLASASDLLIPSFCNLATLSSLLSPINIRFKGPVTYFSITSLNFNVFISLNKPSKNSAIGWIALFSFAVPSGELIHNVSASNWPINSLNTPLLIIVPMITFLNFVIALSKFSIPPLPLSIALFWASNASETLPPANPIDINAVLPSNAVDPKALKAPIALPCSCESATAFSCALLKPSVNSSCETVPFFNPRANSANSGFVLTSDLAKSLTGVPPVAIISVIASFISGLALPTIARTPCTFFFVPSSIAAKIFFNLLSCVCAFNSSAACFLLIPVILDNWSSCII